MKRQAFGQFGEPGGWLPVVERNDSLAGGVLPATDTQIVEAMPHLRV
jgi:hypothetical protein